jgi:multiple sugar transport system permease protein
VKDSIQPTGSPEVLAQQEGTPVSSGWKLPRQTIGYLFVAPAIVFLLLVVAYPLFSTVRMSVVERNYREKTTTFVGLDNYNRALHDPVFWDSLGNTVTYTIGSVVFHVLIGGFFALLLNENWGAPTLRNMVRGLLILPWLFSMAASALIWSLLYQAVSPINHLLTVSGLSSKPVAFLGDPDIAIWSLVAVNVWKYFPFYMIMILGGLQSIPPELYDAA